MLNRLAPAMTLVALSSLASPLPAYASCSGVSDCDECYDLQVLPGPDELECKTSDDCTVVPDGCGDWRVVNKKSIEKATREMPKVRATKLDKAKPVVRCEKGTCQRLAK